MFGSCEGTAMQDQVALVMIAASMFYIAVHAIPARVKERESA